MIRFLQAAVLIAALGMMPLPASAQYGDDWGPGHMMGWGGGWGPGHMGWGGPGPHMGMGGGDGPMMFGRGGRRMEAFIAARLDEVKKEIGITSAQEDAWKAYADSVTARVKTMRESHRSLRDAFEDGTAPDRIEARIAMMETHLAALKETKAALDTLYAALDDEQKKKADDFLGFRGMM